MTIKDIIELAQLEGVDVLDLKALDDFICGYFAAIGD
jgi:hypothetical protein